MILTLAFMCFCSSGVFLSLYAHYSYSHKTVAIFSMYEFGIMAYDVAVISCIVITLERYISRPWLIEKVQILVWHQHLYCSLIDDLTIRLYGYRIRYLVEGNCKSEDYDCNDNCSQANEARRNFAYHVSHLLTSQLDVIGLSFFLFHVKSILASQF